MRAKDKPGRVDFFHDDWLAGTIGLSLEERGAYITICALIYSTGGPLRDEEHVLARQLGVSIRKWRPLRQALIDKRKIQINDGLLDQPRCRLEIESMLNQLRIARETGSAGGRKSAEMRAKSLTSKDTTPRGPQGTLQGGLNLPSPSPSPPSVAKATAAKGLPLEAAKDATSKNGESVNLAELIFGQCLAYLVANGVGDKQARSLLGGWRKNHGPGLVIEVVSEAQRQAVSEPVAWITKALQKRSTRQQGPQAHAGPRRRDLVEF